MRIRACRFDRQRFSQAGLGDIKVAKVHFAVGVVDQKLRVIRAPCDRPPKPPGRFLLVALQGVNQAEQVVNDGVIVLPLHGIRQCLICVDRLAGGEIQFRELRPGGRMSMIQRGNRAECADRRAHFFRFERDQADQEMALGKIRLGAQHSLAALAGLHDAAELQGIEALPKRVLHPGGRRRCVCGSVHVHAARNQERKLYAQSLSQRMRTCSARLAAPSTCFTQ